MNHTQFAEIYNRKLYIYANIRFDPDKREKLDKIMDIIAPNGRKEYLSHKDILFSYCKHRNVWYGTEYSDKCFENKKYIDLKDL